ncbi:MAG: Rne/Rng family ribonuclease [Aphanocapsa lilacina HA4352-LM1]|jgi:ribonuclease E|nr:Rne/Rng family ribonuclease [Aphanocapsa lilacina HA4352-LM1]
MPKQIIIAEQYRLAAVFAEDQIQELIVASGNHQVGDIYLGIVENVLPSIDAAFVNIGNPERNGFIHVTDLGQIRLRRSSASISELVTPQQKVLVQVMKEPTGNKGPRLTGNVSLPGRFLVLMPFGRGVNLSRRIRDDDERNRLRALAVLIKPPGMGLLVRTEAAGMDEQGILEDLESLLKQWEKIQKQTAETRAPALLNRDEDFIQRVLRDAYSAQVNRIVVDSHVGVKRVKQHLLNWNGGRMPQGVYVEHHREPSSILDYFRVNAAIREALRPRVDLPSGGYIIIEPTEALTVIDVNSGSFTRSATSRETVLWTNCEAATEIARQLRLRNIAGIIIIDFIDMDARRDQLQVLEHFSKALKADKSRPQIAQLTELGLVEITRKRQGQSIYEIFGKPCPTCDGLGIITHLPGTRHEHGGEAVPTFAPSAEELEGFEGEEFAGVSTTGEYEEEESSDLDLTAHPVFRNDRRRLPMERRPAAPPPSGNGAPGNTGGGRNRRRRGRGGNNGRGGAEEGLGRPAIETGEPGSGPPPPSPTVRVPEAEPAEAAASMSGYGGYEDRRDEGAQPTQPPVEAPEMPIDHIPAAEQEVLAYMGLPAELLSGPAITSGNTSILSVRPPSPHKPEDEGSEEGEGDPRRRRRRRTTRSKASEAQNPPEPVPVNPEE